jgi:cytochrome d ubiquinol oxidase subunit II
LRLMAPIFSGLAAAVCVTAAFVQPGIMAAWIAHTYLLTLVAGLFLVIGIALFRAVGGRSDIKPFAFALTLFVLGVAGLGLAIFPDVVPFRISLWAAASSTLSQVFLLIGAAIVAPVVLGYSAFAYHVFRGKTPDAGWEQ